MSALALALTPLGLRTLGVGLFLIVLGVGLALLRQRRLTKIVERVRSLALGGHSQEARVLARASGGWAKPLVDALAGERPNAPAHAVGLDVVYAGIAAVAALQGPLAALAMRNEPAVKTLATDVGGLMASMSILLPLAMLAVALIVRLGIVARRHVRGACVEILAHQLVVPARSRKEAR